MSIFIFSRVSSCGYPSYTSSTIEGAVFNDWYSELVKTEFILMFASSMSSLSVVKLGITEIKNIMTENSESCLRVELKIR